MTMHPDFHGVPAGDPFPQTFPRATPLTPDEINRDDAISLRLERTKKGGADDPLEALSGSNGLSACADTTLVLDSDQNGKTLYVRGRDVEEKETALIFAGGFWSILGEAADIHRSSERSQIVAALEDHGEPMTPAEIVGATGKSRVSIQRLLGKTAKADEVHKVGKSRYWLEPAPTRPIFQYRARSTIKGGSDV